MYGLLSKLLINKQMQFSIGHINMFGDAMLIISANSMKKMTDDAIKKGKKGIMDLYLQGWEYGFKITKDMSYALKLKTFDEKYRVSMDIISLIGFGDYQSISYDKGNAYWKVIENPFAMQYYKTDALVDHYMRGLNAGGGTIVQDNMMYCIEKECTAQNGQYCIQGNLEEKLLKTIDDKIVETQLDLDYLIPRQIEIIEKYNEKPEKFNA